MLVVRSEDEVRDELLRLAGEGPLDDFVEGAQTALDWVVGGGRCSE